ncbi:MAG: hypothetical protein AABW64_00235 [Nanoarchaeota archaeon]
MAQINTMTQMNDKKGVLLTLGITFLSLVVLALATIILRSAETSEERLVELAGIDRLYNLGSSTERSLALALYPYTGINMTLANQTIIIERQMYPYPDTTLWNLDPLYFDYKLILGQVLKSYLDSVSKGVNVFSETDIGSSGELKRIWIRFIPSNTHYWLSTLNLSLRDPDRVETNPSGSAYPDFLINSNGTTPNSTHNILIFGYYGQLDPYIISNYTLYFRHDTRNGVINWSRKESPTQTGNSPGTPPGTPPLGGRKINVIIQIDGQNGYTHSMSDDVYINDTKKFFPQVIYLDNLTGDRGCVALGPGCNKIEIPELRPTIRFYEGNGNQLGSGGSSSGFIGQTNALIIANFNEKLFTRMNLLLNTTYLEAYGTPKVQTQLDAFNMSRSRFARYA